MGHLEVQLESGWHLYSPTTPPGGPVPTTIELADSQAVSGYEVYQEPPETKFDPAFQIDTETYGGSAAFAYLIHIAGDAPPGQATVTARVRYQLCNDTQCLPPKRKTVEATFAIAPAAGVVAASVPPGMITASRDAIPATPGGAEATETAVAETATEAATAGAMPVSAAGPGQGLPRFLLVAFGFGLAAIFTPCVFPMIPIMMSHFMQQGKVSRGQSISQAVVFCLGIVVLFSSLGLATTAVLGPFGVVQLGSNPWVNAFIAAIFLVFGLSLLGAFEITLPSGLLTRLNAASDRGGYAGTLLMGLTFSLASFACVGPFVGTLLAASIQEGGARPLMGMVSFSSGLALPFFFLALFPSYLQRMPRAGGWMSRVKVVLGFVILAAMFKYLSNIDQVMQWGVLSRELYLAVWVVLFALPGLYLLGLLRMEGVDPDAKLGIGRLLVGAAFLVFAISLTPGMFGGRLGEIEAYIPAPEQGASIGATASASPEWLKNDYDAALEQARAEHKLVFLAFTGYACTNCHWMKANMFPRPEIASALDNFVRVELYTDGTDEASERNQALQEERFSTIAIPYYAILDADGHVVTSYPGLTRDSEEFLAFLQSKPAS